MDEDGYDRRGFLRGAGAVTGLAMFAAMAERLGLTAAAPGPAPEGPRIQPDPGTVESGLAAFAAKWNGAGPVLAATRFGRFVVNKTFNCHVAESPRAWSLTLGPSGATLSPGRDPTAHADVVLDEADWLDVLGGEFTGLAPVLAGRSYPRRDEANNVVTLLLVMYVAAHLPAELDGDPRFTEELVRGLLQRGVIRGCEGAPPSLDTLERLREDPRGRASEPTLAPNDVPPVTRELAAFVHELSFEDLGPEQVDLAKRQLKNVLGPVYAAHRMPPAANLLAQVRDWGEGGPATVVGPDGFETNPRGAAMANAYLAQALEWEDWTNLAHSGSAVVPVALAAAEAAGASGRELVTAIAAGNEILARLGGVLTDIVHSGQALPIHQIELPLVAGKLLGLSRTELEHAAGLAGAQPQLTSLPAWTSDAKGLVTAEPAGASLRAAQLAGAGLSGRRDQLENPLGAIYRLSDVRHPRDLGAAIETLGEAWTFREEAYFNKRYPVDGFTLTAVHATRIVHHELEQAGLTPLDPRDVEAIRVHQNLPLASTATMFSEGSEAILDRVRSADRSDWTYTSLLFDGRYPLLATLLRGDLTEAPYRLEALPAGFLEDVRELWSQVYAAPDLSMGVFGAQVAVDTADGDTIRAGAGQPRGPSSTVGCIREDVNHVDAPDERGPGDPFDPGNPDRFTADDKFAKTAGSVLSEARLSAVLDAIDGVEDEDDVNAFTSKL